MYSQDYDEKFPRCGYGGECSPGADNSIPAGMCNQYGSSEWQNTTAPYVKNLGLYVSPGDAAHAASGDWWNFDNPDGQFSMLFNDLLAHESATGTDGYYGAQVHFATGGSQASVTAPADCVMLAEGHGGWIKGAGLPDPNPDAAGNIVNPIPSNQETKWHKEMSISGNFTPFITSGSYMTGLPPSSAGLPFYSGGSNFAYVDGHAKWIRTADSNGNPTLCGTLPWQVHMDPQQRGSQAQADWCGGSNTLITSGNWGGHQWF
jgi:prepilin-type processing-associated H-X9-DG protein